MTYSECIPGEIYAIRVEKTRMIVLWPKNFDIHKPMCDRMIGALNLFAGYPVQFGWGPKGYTEKSIDKATDKEKLWLQECIRRNKTVNIQDIKDLINTSDYEIF